MIRTTYGLIGAFIAGITVYFGLNNFQTQQQDEHAVSALFAQTLQDADGNPQILSRWKGKVLIVNFWATWCAPCVEEIPELSKLQTKIGAKGWQVIGIGADSLRNIKEFSSRHAVSYPLYAAGIGGSDLPRQFGDTGGALPYTVLIGADGRVIKTYLGRLNIDKLQIDLGGL